MIRKFGWWLISWLTHSIYHHGFQSRALLQASQDSYRRYEKAAMAFEDEMR